MSLPAEPEPKPAEVGMSENPSAASGLMVMTAVAEVIRGTEPGDGSYEDVAPDREDEDQ